MSHGDGRRGTAAGVAFALAMLAAANGGTIARAQDPRPDSVTSYLAIVTEYLSGDPVQAVASLGRWSPLSTLAVQRAVTWDAKTMRAAAMLETDTAFSARTSFDSMTERLESAANWLTRADLVARDTATSRMRQQWHLTVGRALIWNGFMGVANRMLSAASRLYPNDVDLLLASGIAKESLAQTFVVDPALPESQTSPLRKRRSEMLAEARTSFERVLKAAPGTDEARVRLARLFVLQGDDRRAAVLLEEARASSPPPRKEIGYLASLLLGELRARNGQLGPAVELFREARRLVPGGQNAYLAHARALRSAGQLEAAAVVVQEMLARPVLQGDPWRQYPLGFDEAATNLAPLRDEVRRQ